MQVKKFEARSMKEALEMIKTQLGPDAIILSAKETTKKFGLGGEKSIEVTAAFSEKTIQNKKFVESKMPISEKEKFQKIPAKNQKEVMQKVIEAQIEKLNSQTLRSVDSNKKRSTTTALSQQVTMTKNSSLQASATNSWSQRTGKRYADIEDDASGETVETVLEINRATEAKNEAVPNDVASLRSEIESLKTIITQFKSMPQSFVQAHPGAECGIHYSMSGYFQKLLSRGVSYSRSSEIILEAQKQIVPHLYQNKNAVEGWIAKYILESVPLVSDASEQFHLFMGPSGSGKTTTLIKLVSDLILKERKRVALITLDNSKIGSAEQMKIFSQILNVPFLSLKSPSDWNHVIPHLDQLDHVLVDYPGMNLRSQDEVNFLKSMSPIVCDSMRAHLVFSALSKDADMIEYARRYQAFGVDDYIFTAIDEATLHGNIYNLIREIPIPIFAFGIGSKVPEDIEKATAERVADLILQITQTQQQRDMSI